MATLSKETIQRLAVLRALSLWRRGAYGPLRLQKVLFFADRETNAEWRLFTFKRWWLGQFSDEISASLNALRNAGRITTLYDGPSERIKAELSGTTRIRLTRFFQSYFREWAQHLGPAFKEWAYLSNDAIVKKAHDDPSYTSTEHGAVIFPSFKAAAVEFRSLSDETAEDLADLVDSRLQRTIATRLTAAAKRPILREDWRHIYFGDTPCSSKAVATTDNGNH